MRSTILRSKVPFALFLIILLSGATLFSQAIGQNPIRDKDTRWTRITISTSGSAKFNSYWLTWPPRLVIEFQSKNIIGKIDDEIVINQGMLKKITSSYFEKEQNKSLKSLTFEFTRKVPYKIWQEDNKILLDIQAPLKISGLPEENNEVLVRSETGAVIVKKLEAMEKALTEVAESKPKTEIGKVEPEIPLVERSVLPVVKPVKMGDNIMGILFWLIGLALASGIGFLGWLFWHRYRLILDKNIAIQEVAKLRQEITKLKSELQEKNRLFEQEEIIRKSIEDTSLAREKEFGQLKNSYESLKGVLVRKGLAKELSSPEGKRGLWIPGKSEDRRTSPRLSLTKDFNNTAIVKIESRNSPRAIKCFAKDISLEGLCLETPKELDDKDPINLRLFFYGGKIPNIKTQTRIIWKKTADSMNCYGVSFEGLSEKVKLELGHYIESRIEPVMMRADKIGTGK